MSKPAVSKPNNRLSALLQSYSRFMSVPWQPNAASSQRVIFCVYHPDDELRLRARIDEFALATERAGHHWLLFDLTNLFAEWLCDQRYADRYFSEPQLLPTLLPRYGVYISDRFTAALQTAGAGANTLVALQGAGALFGLRKVKQVVDDLAPQVSGRLVVFFPGSYENNNYRLLDGYDGWNYLAVPITAGRDQ